jgi:DNA-binding beta-propeller fold protein YncE
VKGSLRIVNALHLNLRAALAVAVTAVSAAAGAAPASAGNSIYWGTESPNTVSFANLDGSGGGNLTLTGATTKGITGVAIDAAAGRVYWANNETSTISYANLDGSGGRNLPTTGATVNEPFGVAIDPAAGRIYWANVGNATISYANLNGTGGGDIPTTGATIELPTGVAVDPANEKIYWDNFHNPGGSISFANLNGTGGGGNLKTTGATVEGPEGLAIDPVSQRIYWANYHNASASTAIGYADLNGTGGGDLTVTGAKAQSPSGIAIDPVAQRIYWADSTTPGGGISYANLNGTGGGGNLNIGSANVVDPAFPALLEAPSGERSPLISGASTTGSALSCSQGSWASDVVSEFFYRAPQSYAYSWWRNGAEIAGASSQTFTPRLAGTYTCRVTAANHAGASTQTSAAVTVSAAAAAVSAAPISASPPSPAPTITGAHQSTSRWREGDKLAQISRRRKRPPVGTTFSFTLNEQAAVTFSFAQNVAGRKLGHKCVAKTHKKANHEVCKRSVTAGSLSFTGHSGTNKVIFQGRVSLTKKLKPGRYTLIVEATNSAGRSTPARLTFTIVR